MHIAGILFGIILALLYGAVFHLIFGGKLGRLLLFLAAAQVGFWLAQSIADRFDWNLVNLGAIHLDASFLGALLFLALAHWLSQTSGKKKNG